MESLPEELLDHIFKRLMGPLENPSLTVVTSFAALCLVSHQFRRIAEPYLYSAVSINLTTPHIFFGSKPDLLERSGAELFALLQRRGEIARYVRTIRIRNIASKLRLSEREYKTYDGYTHHLLALLPNLEYLDTFNYGSSTTRQPFLISQKYQQDHLFSFSKLKRLDADLGRNRLLDLHSIFKLSQIETLNFRYGHLPRNSTLNPGSVHLWNFEASTLKNISFTDIGYDGGVVLFLRVLSNVCVSLESLRFENHFHRYSGETFKNIIHAFESPIRNSLRRLELWDEHPDTEDTAYASHSAHKIYKEAPYLEEVKLDFRVLGRWHHPHAQGEAWLQANIETSKTLRKLWLRDFSLHGDGALQSLRALGEDIRAVFPVLEEVTVELQNDPCPWTVHNAYLNICTTFNFRDAAEVVKARFAEHGIRFEVIPIDTVKSLANQALNEDGRFNSRCHNIP